MIDVVGLSDIQRYVLFNRYKENEEYMFINNDIATFTHVPEKNYKYPTEYYWIGAENMLKDEINKRNAASKDLQGRQCYQIDIYEKALTLHGLYSLPWEGYDKAILIDVRSSQEYEDNHIDGAININVDDILNTEGALIYNNSEIGFNKTIIVYCRSGARSKNAANKLVELGYRNVYDLGSIDNWS